MSLPLALAACGAPGGAPHPNEATPAASRAADFTVTRTADREVTMRRSFAAPRSEVFAALTTPALLRRWLAADGRELSVCEVDLRAGGAYRYLFEGVDGSEFGMYGTFREVVPGERTVHTEEYDGYDWEPLVVTTELTEEAGQTTVVMTVVYPSKEICDVDIANLQASAAVFDRLDDLLASSK